MLARPRIKVLGYRWLSSGGHNACPRCVDLHGKEFYFRPSGGQLSVDEMPEPPLHPNCRCTMLEMVGFDGPDLAPEENDDSPEANSISKDKYVGLRWRRSSPFDGPVYEKYGGLIGAKAGTPPTRTPNLAPTRRRPTAWIPFLQSMTIAMIL